MQCPTALYRSEIQYPDAIPKTDRIPRHTVLKKQHTDTIPKNTQEYITPDTIPQKYSNLETITKRYIEPKIQYSRYNTKGNPDTIAKTSINIQGHSLQLSIQVRGSGQRREKEKKKKYE